MAKNGLDIILQRNQRRQEKELRRAEAEKQRKEILKNIIASPPKYQPKPIHEIDSISDCFRKRAELSSCKPYFGNSISSALDHVTVFDNRYIRKLKDFSVRFYNNERQFSALLRHLFAKYKIPVFMDSIWFQENYPNEWFIDVAQGKNIRTCFDNAIGITHLPKLTKKQCHLLMETPGEYNFHQAIRYGQILGIGGDRNILQHLLFSRLFTDRYIPDEEFMESVIRFFVQNTMLDSTHINPLIDFIFQQKSITADWTLKGRTAISLIRQMEEWHHELQKKKAVEDGEWLSHLLDDVITEGQNETKIDWKFNEICSSKMLDSEGKAMKHCVYSYKGSCKNENCAIVSLKENGERALTIEVNLRSRTIAQLRGFKNRFATPRERRVVVSWGNRHGLIVSKWL